MSGRFKAKLQLLCGEEIAMGPGKADLLEAIRATGSISAAARHLGMSYRRAWMLVEVMNRLWAEPLVHATPGARKGATLTPFGEAVLSDYRRLDAGLATTLLGEAATALQARLR